MAANKIQLTHKFLMTEKPAQPGERKEIADAQVPGLRLRINHHKKEPKTVEWDDEPEREISYPNGQYIFYGPARKGAPAVRRSLGGITEISLREARRRAQALRDLIRAGKDPDEEKAAEAAAKAKRKQAEAALAASTFGLAMEEYLKRVDKQRRGASTRADIERDLLPFWRDRPLHEITKKDIRARITEIAEGKNRGSIPGKKTKKRGASPRQARAALSYLKTFFDWAEDAYDLENIPTNSKGLGKLIEPTKPRKRILSDDEIRAFWQAADETDAPLGAGYKLLLITGARLNEIFEAEKKELGSKGTLLTIPPERFKSDSTHLIPLSPLAVEIVAGLKVWKKCTHLFSRDGKGPARVWSKDRIALHNAMERILKKMAVDRGADPDEVELAPFVLHDLRRTVRTRLSALRVDETVAEMVIGHGRKGIQRVYDLHKFEPEMREALELWGDHLKAIVEPHPAAPAPAHNVIDLGKRRRKA